MGFVFWALLFINYSINTCYAKGVAKIITQEVSPEAKVIFRAIQDEKLKKGEIKVTVIATGF